MSHKGKLAVSFWVDLDLFQYPSPLLLLTKKNSRIVREGGDTLRCLLGGSITLGTYIKFWLVGSLSCVSKRFKYWL